jgi:hypothetical protein
MKTKVITDKNVKRVAKSVKEEIEAALSIFHEKEGKPACEVKADYRDEDLSAKLVVTAEHILSYSMPMAYIMRVNEVVEKYAAEYGISSVWCTMATTPIHVFKWGELHEIWIPAIEVYIG